MRILKVVQAYFPFQEKGGPVVKVRSIALGLAARGHSVTVLTSNYRFPSFPAAGFLPEKCKWGWRAEERGVSAIYLRSWGEYRALTFNPAVVSFASGSVSDFDLAHIYGLYDLLGPVVGFFFRSRKVPYVVEPMGMYRPIIRNLQMKRLYHRLLGNRLLRGAHRLIATSELEEKELIAGGIQPARIAVRRNGLEAPESLPLPGSFRRQWQIPPQTKLILYLGRLISKKSPDLLLEAFARWRRKTNGGEDSVLVLAGPEEGNGYGTRLKSLAASAGIARSVLFTGHLYDDAKWAAYRDADVFVLPSQNENFGNSAAEAMACGTPVIVTDRCGIAPLVRQDAGLVVQHDPAAVANALELLLKDAGLAARLRARSAETARSLSWDEPLSQMEALYSEAVGMTVSA
ncbi:MAG TPA: glycosyltransferase [Candidatus Acidoferrales bacterium]|nr:glycosyltransferase [Candidatus Acidoferrales bacterium]